MQQRELKQLSVYAILFLLITSFLVYFQRPVDAATLTESAIRLDRMGASVAASSTNKILVIAKPATGGTETTVKLTWPTSSAFTVDTQATTHTVTTSGIAGMSFQGELVTAWPGIGSSASSVGGGTVTFPSTDLTVGTLYGFYITGGITNPSTGNAGTKQVTITTQSTGPATVDSQTVAVDTTTTSSDLVTVTAQVASSFNFALNSNSIALGTLSTGSVSTGNVTIDVDTNATNGWAAWLRSDASTAALASASTGGSFGSTGTVNGSTETVTAGTENYVVDVNVSAGTLSNGSRTISTEYDGNGTTTGGTLSTSYQEIVYSTGQADSDTITLTAIASINAVTKAATDYTDTWEVVGAGNF